MDTTKPVFSSTWMNLYFDTPTAKAGDSRLNNRCIQRERIYKISPSEHPTVCAVYTNR